MLTTKCFLVFIGIDSSLPVRQKLEMLITFSNYYCILTEREFFVSRNISRVRCAYILFLISTDLRKSFT